MVEKILPHNHDAEESLVGSLLIDGDVIKQETIDPADFFHEESGLDVGGGGTSAFEGSGS